MDIESLYTQDRHNAGSKMVVSDEFGNDTELYLLLAGPDSDVWMEISRKNQQKAISRMINKEDAETDDNTLMVLEAVIDWGGVDVPYTKEACLVLLQKAPYIVDQAILFISNRINFMVS